MRPSIKLFIALLMLTGKVFAVEVTPSIGFKSDKEALNQVQDPKESLNNKIFSENQILTKAVPDINSVGLNFTFKVD